MDSLPASNTQVGYTGLVNKACKCGLTEGTVINFYLDNALYGVPVERTVEYEAPYFKPDRAEDYCVAWGIFENEIISREN